MIETNSREPTSNLVVTHWVISGLVVEPLQTEDVQVEHVAVLGKLPDLKTGSSWKNGFAIGPPDTGDLNGSSILTPVQFLGSFLDQVTDLVEMGVQLLWGTVLVVMTSVLQSNSGLEEDQKCEKHGDQSLWFAEGGHDGRVMIGWVQDLELVATKGLN